MGKRLIIFCLVLFTSGIFLLGISFGRLSSSKNLSQPTQPSLDPGSSIQTKTGEGVTVAEREKATVTRVIDGDTIEINDGRKVRYIGIDTPETVDPRKQVQCFGKEAAEKNRELVMGSEVEMEKDLSEQDNFGRLLRYVYVPVNGAQVMVNEYLVTEGFAQSITYPPDVKYQALFQEAEKKARELNRGLWLGCGKAIDSQPTNSSNPTLEKSGNEVANSQPATTTSTNQECLIKGNISSKGEKIYHLPGCGSYDKTVVDESRGEKWFCTEGEATAKGFRKAKNC